MIYFNIRFNMDKCELTQEQQVIVDKIKASGRSRLDARSAAADEVITDARRKLAEEALKTVEILLDLRQDIDPTIRLNAAKHLTKLMGLEVNQVQHTGNVTITVEQAHACAEAFNDDTAD